jgi:hypothetical protein
MIVILGLSFLSTFVMMSMDRKSVKELTKLKRQIKKEKIK